MDANLSGLVEANVNLSQAWWIPLINVSAGIIGAFVGGGTIFAIEWLKIRHSEDQRRQQLYSQLTGRKAMLTQSLASYFAKYIEGLYLENRSRIVAIAHINYAIIEKDSISKEEISKDIDTKVNCIREGTFEFNRCLDAINKSSDMLTQIGKSREFFWETIGSIRTTFPRTQELKELIHHIQEAEIKSFRGFEETVIERHMSLRDKLEEEIAEIESTQELNSWVKTKVAEAQSLGKGNQELLKANLDNLESKIADLLKYLETEIETK